MKKRLRPGGKTVKERARRAPEPRRNNAPKTVRGRCPPAENAKSEVVRLSRELNEALERATATAEVLTVINSSPGDLTPVFDVIAKRAMRLCGAAFGGVWLIDGDRVRVVAAINVPRPFAEFVAQDTAAGRSLRSANGSAVSACRRSQGYKSLSAARADHSGHG